MDEIKQLQLVVSDTTQLGMRDIALLYNIAKAAGTLDVFAGIAVDFAKAADKELDRLAPFTQWVETAKDMPAELQRVIVFHPIHGQGVGYWRREQPVGEGYWWCQFIGKLLDVDPTHWHVMIDDPK